MMRMEMLLRIMKDAWRKLKAKSSYACTINKLLPAIVYLDVNSAGRWCLKSSYGDVFMLNRNGMLHDIAHESLEDVLSSLYEFDMFIVHEKNSDGTWVRLISNPFFKCRSLEEVAVKNELEI